MPWLVSFYLRLGDPITNKADIQPVQEMGLMEVLMTTMVRNYSKSMIAEEKRCRWTQGVGGMKMEEG